MKLLKTQYVALVLLLIVSLYTIFYRPILNVGGRKLSFYVLLMSIELAYFVINNNIHILIKYLKVFRTEFFYIGWILLVVIVRTILGGDFDIFIGQVKFLFFLFLNACFVVTFVKNNFKEDNAYIRFALVVGSIAALISTGCIVDDNFRFFIDHKVQYFNEDLKQSDYLFRCFGLSSGLLFEYGIVQGILLAIGLMGIKNNKWFIFAIPFVILSIILNARTGIVVAFAGAATMSIVNTKVGNVFRTVLLMIVAMMAFMWILPQLDISKESMSFITEFTVEVENVFINKDLSGSSTFNALINGNPWPQYIDEWIYGTGKDIMYGGVGRASDVGYMRQLNYGGLLYVIPLYLFILIIFIKWKKNNPSQAYLFLVTLIIANFKGDVMGTSIFDFFFILYMFSITSNQNNNYAKKHPSNFSRYCREK